MLEIIWPDEADRMDDSNYCKYHHLISNPIEKCFVLKEKIIELYNIGKVELEQEAASSNLASMTIKMPQSSCHNDFVWELKHLDILETKTKGIVTNLFCLGEMVTNDN